MGVGHYENFPVASVLLPAHLRRPVAAIYRFARSADDLADEGDLCPPQRLHYLREYQQKLQRIEHGEQVEDPLFIELAHVVGQHRLPLEPFYDLLDAFSQDVVKSRYASFAELLDYSRRSADPVGRLLLHLFGATSAETCRHSDLICSALQFINFWQDVVPDYAKNRIYLPQQDMQHFGVTETHLAAKKPCPQFRMLMQFQIERTRRMLYEGAALGRMLPGRTGLEIRMVVAGGDTILQKLLNSGCDVFRQRPVLRSLDWLSMFWRACCGDGRIGL